MVQILDKNEDKPQRQFGTKRLDFTFTNFRGNILGNSIEAIPYVFTGFTEILLADSNTSHLLKLNKPKLC